MYSLFIVATLAAVTLAQNPFLYSQPYAKRWEFEQLLAKSQGLPKAEIDRRVVQWVGQQNPTIQQEWAQFNWRMQQAANEYQYRLTRMSPEARKADQRLTQVANYPYFSAEEKGYLVHQIIDSLQPNVKSEILEVLMNARPVNF